MTFIGITGHRGLPAHTTQLIEQALRYALAGYGTDVIGVTALADGADQIFARAVLDQGGQLEVIVPATRYRDGLPAESHAAYDDFINQAVRVHRLDLTESTPASHMAGSELLISMVSELLAVWDGQPARDYGGTADVVAHARDRGRTVRVIWPDGATRVGVRDPESVAEHSLRVAQLASLIAAMEGAEPGRAAFLAVWYDSQETRTGDIPHTAKPYLDQHSAEMITADQTAALPDAVRKTVQEAVAEYEAQQTPEARCAKDADKLECLIQAVEYRDAGYGGVQSWIDSSRSGLRTNTARRIADAALVTSPLAWRGR